MSTALLEILDMFPNDPDLRDLSLRALQTIYPGVNGSIDPLSSICRRFIINVL